MAKQNQGTASPEGLDWEVTPSSYIGSGDVGKVGIGDITVEISRFGGGNRHSGTSKRSTTPMPPYYTLSVDFSDGCHCGGGNYDTQAEVEAYLDHLRSVSDKVTEQVERRRALDSRIAPLSSRRSKAASIMFGLVVLTTEP
ncbi:hypothetical protein LCGC14_1137510 [marine sediment metagenome]|uniref:Uncharacterized protein n=1 Tax=marine sediment metagenome TaxID=412755 RepID=A0A0F9LZB6_9ZZZZ